MRKLITFLLIVLFGASTTYSQTYLNADFESGQGSWVFYDNNSDNQNWALINAFGVSSEFGNQSLISFSYANSAPITPDNLVISPAINLTNASGNVYLEYQYFTHPEFPAEKYSIYVTTSNTPANILASVPVYSEVATSNNSLVNRQINLSSYMGQTVHITFRHHDCYDQYYLLLDNVKVRTLQPNDVELKSVSSPKYILNNQDTTLSLELKNVGNNSINSVTVNWNDGTDHSANIPVTIQPGATTIVNHPTAMNYTVAGTRNISVTATQVNNATDPDMTNNNQEISTSSISQDGGTKVLLEEGTGTWCMWCPRGKIAMDYMYTNHSDKFVGIFVHNNDPMAVSAYDGASQFSGFPGMHIDRTIKNMSVSQNLMETYVLERSTDVNPVAINVETVVQGNELTVNASATFYTDLTNANLRFAAVLIEDDVRGTTSGYNQRNAYAGGTNGPMGGFENLPDPVPANQMVYNHVGRALLGGYNGVENSVPTSITDGQTVDYTFNYTIPSTFKHNRLSVAVLILDATTGQVLNVNTNEGYLNISDFSKESFFSVYPNPASDIVSIQLIQDGKYAVKIYDITGKVVLSKNSEYILSNTPLSLPVSSLSQGAYIISIEGGGQSFSKQLIIK